MKKIKRMKVGELAAYVSSHLGGCGIDVVLSGGSCVAIYSDGRYVSRDLDFIDTRFSTRAQISDAMAIIGFTPENRYFKHLDTDYLIEFPSGPPAVGKEPIGAIHELHFTTGLLRILSPTDCVKDRLSAYYHWKDQQSLDQAIIVAQTNIVDLAEIKRWSKREGMAAAFADIESMLRDGQNTTG